MRQYTQEIFSGRTVDGRRTLSENIADNGGLLAAFQGFQNWFQRSQGDPDLAEEFGLLPGLPYTHEQLVFLGFARAHCSRYKFFYLSDLN